MVTAVAVRGVGACGNPRAILILVRPVRPVAGSTHSRREDGTRAESREPISAHVSRLWSGLSSLVSWLSTLGLVGGRVGFQPPLQAFEAVPAA